MKERDLIQLTVTRGENLFIKMWYEVLPSMVIIGLVPVVPYIVSYYANQYFLGNPMRRDMTDIWDRHMYTRDTRLHGAPWKNKGLENIPDD